jgi:hypothetical protein
LLRQPLAWKFAGLRRTAWFAAKAAGRLPQPVEVNGVLYWRRSDLEAFVSRLQPARVRRRHAAD